MADLMIDLKSDLLAAVHDVIAREAAALDEQRWDEWVALYQSNCEYWVPTWVDESHLAQDPQTELSHIYYASRAGLEDRLARVRSGKSPASTPLRRTTHTSAHVRVLDGSGPHEIHARSSWTCHVFDPSSRGTYVLFGRAEYTLVRRDDDDWGIARKKVVVNNDYLPAMVDFYCL